jgi:hypothetical protein
MDALNTVHFSLSPNTADFAISFIFSYTTQCKKTVVCTRLKGMISLHKYLTQNKFGVIHVIKLYVAPELILAVVLLKEQILACTSWCWVSTTSRGPDCFTGKPASALSKSVAVSTV